MKTLKAYLVLAASAAALTLTTAAPAGAAVLYQSIPDLTVAPSLNAYCSQCGGDGQSIGQVFSLGSAATANSLTFAVDSSYVWPTSVTVGIYNDAAGSVGSNVYNQTFSSFASDVPTGNGTDLVTVNLGAVSLAPGTYDLFMTNPADLGIPAYSGGPGNQIFIPVGMSSSPLLTGDSYSNISGSDSAISLSSAPGPVPGAGFAGLAALALAGLYARTRRA